MPLHLLGKKSWNVYNKANIERVRRDEALAKAREEENESREQQLAAEKRIQILRGLREPSPAAERPAPLEDESGTVRERREPREHRPPKRRRLAGEDDTDRDIRLAKDDVQRTEGRRGAINLPKPSNDVPLVDDSGHINLFPADSSRKLRTEKNPEAEAEEAKKKREFEDQYTMRFSNAAGFKQGLEKPWYSSASQGPAAETDLMPTKDVWGNEDPRRRDREKLRLVVQDPLAMMKKGVRQLREVEKERKKWDEERRRELQALKQEQKESRGRHRRRSAGSPDSLESFRLDDAPAEDKDERRRRHRSHRDHREKGEHRSSHSRSHSKRHSHHHPRKSSTKHAKSRSPTPDG